jgi:chemotaxis-related protein WspD
MNELPQNGQAEAACWTRIGVWGDRSCPELQAVSHCHHCPVFAGAGRQFLTAAAPAGYLQEWAARLAAPPEETAADLVSVLTFRLGEEWLALPVQALVEVTAPRPVHRIPHRLGLLAGLVNIRGELHLCVHLDQLLGIRGTPRPSPMSSGRLLVTEWQGQRWVFSVDEVDQVRRVAQAELAEPPPTVALATDRFSAGVFREGERRVGLLDPERLFPSVQGKLR